MTWEICRACPHCSSTRVAGGICLAESLSAKPGWECCFATCCQLRPSGICSGWRTQLCLLRILSFRLEACFLMQILRENCLIFISIDLSKVISEEIACKDYPYSYNSPDSCTHKYRLFSFHHFRSILTRLFKSLGISILYSRLVDST